VYQTDIRQFIKHAKLPLEMNPVPCPIDPSRSMWPGNIAVLSRPTFDTVMTLYQMTNSRALYVATVQRCNLLSRKFDVSRPNNPWHDPNYVRVDLDAAALMRAEEVSLIFDLVHLGAS
jgi:hypothetical protein